MKNIVIILNILLLFEFIISDCDIEDAEPSDCANITLKDYEKKKDHVGYVPDTCCYIHHIDRDYSMGFSEESVKECIPMKKDKIDDYKKFYYGTKDIKCESTASSSSSLDSSSCFIKLISLSYYIKFISVLFLLLK